MVNALSYNFGTTPEHGTASTVTVSPPPAYNAGDLLILCAQGGVPTAGFTYPATPSGWTALSAGSTNLGVFYKTASGSESPYTVTFSTACVGEAFVAAYPPATIVSSSFPSSASNAVTYTDQKSVV